MDKKELRFLADNIEGKTDSRKITGYASKYDSMSKDLGGFVEIIERGAFKKAVDTSADIIANINHDNAQILARSGKNLKLIDDRIGLYFELEVPKTSYGNDLLVNVRAGNVSKCSFAFEVGRDRWENINGKNVRIIEEVKELFDIAIVTIPAYEDTSVAIRKFKSFARETETRKRRAKTYE